MTKIPLKHVRAFLAISIASCALIVVPASVFASPDSSLDQYTEYVPGPGKQPPANGYGDGKNGNGLPPVSKKTAQELESSGADGEALSQLVDGTSGGSAGTPGDRAADNQARSKGGPDSDGSSAADRKSVV